MGAVTHALDGIRIEHGPLADRVLPDPAPHLDERDLVSVVDELELLTRRRGRRYVWPHRSAAGHIRR